MSRLKLDDILALAPQPEAEKVFTIRVSARALAMLMVTRWTPENNPEYRVKVVGVNEHDDGFSDLIVVGETA